MYIIGPALHFGNFWSSLEFPAPITSHLYDTNFNTFNVSAVVTPDLKLDTVAFEQTKPSESVQLGYYEFSR